MYAFFVKLQIHLCPTYRYAKLEMAYRNVVRVLADADMAEESNSVARIIRDRSNPFEEFEDGEFF